MKKIKLLFGLLLTLMIADSAFATIGLKIDGVAQPSITDLNLVGTGTNQQITQTSDGLTFSFVVGGIKKTASASINSSTANISDAGYSLIFKDLPATAQSGTLANGTPGQILVIQIAVDNGGSWFLVPTTKTGFNYLFFNDQDDRAVLMYVDDTYGWVVLSTDSVDST